MKTFHINCPSGEIPDCKESFAFQKNAWISPSGDFYGFKGAKHEIAATYIAVFKLGADGTHLKHGHFFKDSWESYLLRNGWTSIKNLSWIDMRNQPSTFKSREPLTEKQKTTIFDYSEAFGYDYEKLLTGNQDGV